ncbi:hypothetical protein Tco_0287861 [Tanacetum coccineum]
MRIARAPHVSGLEPHTSTAALPRHGKGSWDEEKKEKVQGEMSSKELVKTRFFSTGHGVKLEGSMNYAKGKS